MKLLEFYLYDFKTLLDELKKKKVKLSSKQQIDLMDLFEDYQKRISEDNSTIKLYEDKIDKYMYDTFDLTQEEIEYIEMSIKS